jgi:hypothetical protein
MDDRVELDRERRDRLPALIDYLQHDQVQRAINSGQPIINITINEAPRDPPSAIKEPDVMAKYAPYLMLATWSMIVLAGVAVIFVMIAGALMTIMISLAVCVLAIAASVRALRYSKYDASRHE